MYSNKNQPGMQNHPFGKKNRLIKMFKPGLNADKQNFLHLSLY